MLAFATCAVLELCRKRHTVKQKTVDADVSAATVMG